MRRRFRKQQESKNKVFRRSGDWQKNVEDFRNALRACANTVTNALNGLDGVTAKVSLKENSAEVSYDREIDQADLKNAVKNAGYEVTSIS